MSSDTTVLPTWDSLSLREKIGQMIVVRTSGYLFDSQIRYPSWEATSEQLKHYIQEFNVGGIILLGASAVEIALRSQQLQQWAKIPLLIAADIEEGVGQRFEGATEFPPPMALGEIANTNPEKAQEYAYQMGAVTAQEAAAIGINWILAPVVDVNNNPNNPVINVRAFGETPASVSQLATHFIQGAQPYPVLTTAKHFPGHGDTATDSHLHLPIIPHSAARLAQVELPPFQAAIAAGVDAIMSAHLLIPAWDNDHPATLSHKILTEQLREKLGFARLIVTDALIMGGVSQLTTPQEIAIQAVEAGADILLMPEDPILAIEAIADAVAMGRISEERIDASMARIWQAKEKCLATASKALSLDFLSPLAQPQARETAIAISKASMQSGGNLPLALPSAEKKGSLCNLIVVDDVLRCNFLGRHTPAVTIPQQLGYEVEIWDLERFERDFSPEISASTVVQLFIRGNPFRGSAGLTENTQNKFKKILRERKVEGLVIYGSPYVMKWFSAQLSPEFPWLFSYGQIPISQAIALEKLWGMSRSPDFQPAVFI